MEQQTTQHTQTAQNNGSGAAEPQGGSEAQASARSGASGEREGASIERRGAGRQQLSGRPTAESWGASPFAMVRRMMDDMDRMFESFGFGSMGAPFAGFGSSLRQLQSWSPQIEVTEQDGRLVVRADVPGVATDDLHIELEGEALTISGERRGEERQQRGNRSYTERTYGAFSRTIPLPEAVDADQVEASFENGVLEVRVTLPQQAQSRRRIPIRTGQEESTGQPH